MLLLLLGNQLNEITGEYYVSIDSIEPGENNQIQMVFDGVTKKSFNEMSNNNIRQMYEEIIPYLIIVNADQSFLNSFFPIIWSRNFTGKWFLLKTTKSQTSLPAILSIENSENPELAPIYINSIEYITRHDDVSKNLIQFFSWSHFDRGNTIGIENHLFTIAPAKVIHKHNVYKVGQGNLTAVTDQENTPLFYFDLGGAWWLYRATYPVTLRLCFNRTRTVIISHWDLDHVETARRIFYSDPAQLQRIIWIAPKQTLTPLYARLAARMAATGTLLLWSGNYIQVINFWAGQLLKCNGPEKNHNGIALLVNSPNNSINNVLNPGDAAYKYIPNMKKLKLDGLVATHHGANFPDNNAPIPLANKGAIAYSHGNRYGHPTAASVANHQASGWINMRETPNNHISFTTNPITNNVPCGGANCDLSIVQTF